jgi:hypothetical protein
MHNHRRILVVAVLLVAPAALVARLAVAQQGVEERFGQLDRNGDGRVTPDELPARALFRRLDLDGDGAITKPEAVTAVRQGALSGLRGNAGGAAGGTGPAGDGGSGTDAGAAAPAEPPVREGPKPVRPGDHGIGRRVDDAPFTDLGGTQRSLAAFAAGRITVPTEPQVPAAPGGTGASLRRRDRVGAREPGGDRQAGRDGGRGDTLR